MFLIQRVCYCFLFCFYHIGKVVPLYLQYLQSYLLYCSSCSFSCYCYTDLSLIVLTHSYVWHGILAKYIHLHLHFIHEGHDNGNPKKGGRRCLFYNTLLTLQRQPTNEATNQWPSIQLKIIKKKIFSNDLLSC